MYDLPVGDLPQRDLPWLSYFLQVNLTFSQRNMDIRSPAPDQKPLPQLPLGSGVQGCAVDQWRPGSANRLVTQAPMEMSLWLASKVGAPGKANTSFCTS